MKELLFFDSNACFGGYVGKDPDERWTCDHLVEDMDLAGIAGALVWHRQSYENDSMRGNRLLLDEIRSRRNRLFPCWTALPETCGDFPSTAEFVSLLDEYDVQAVRIQPDIFGVPVRESVWGDLRDALAERDTLILTSTTGRAADGENVDRLLNVFRHNKVLLQGVSWHDMWRWLVYFMSTYSGLHMDFTRFQSNRAVEYMAGRYGAERCVFGTGLPQMAPGAARGFLDWSLLPHDQAVMVAGGNLKRLLHERGPTEIPRPGCWSDNLTRAERNGEPLPCYIADDHCHIVADGRRHAGKGMITVDGDADHMIEMMRKIGIDLAAIMSWAWADCDPDDGNAVVEHAVERYPDEFVGVLSIMPEVQNQDDIRAAIRRYHGELRWPGLKPFARGAYEFTDSVFETWFKYASENSLYVVYDPKTIYESGRQVIAELTGKYPGMGIHLDHCGRSWPFARWAVEMAEDFPNVYLQLNFTSVTNGTIEYMAEHAGSDRLLFGTDSPCRDPRPQVSWLVFTRLSEVDKRMIFGENFRQVLTRAFQDGSRRSCASSR